MTTTSKLRIILLAGTVGFIGLEEPSVPMMVRHQPPGSLALRA